MRSRSIEALIDFHRRSGISGLSLMLYLEEDLMEKMTEHRG